MSEAEKLLERFAKKNMIEWDQKSFKRTHSRLHTSIIEAINEANSVNSENANCAIVMPVFLEELAKKHKVDVTKIMIGKVGKELYVWRYDEGTYEVFKTLEIIPQNGA